MTSFRDHPMTDSAELRPWSSLSESEQTELMLACQPVLDGESLTCNFERMQAFLKTRGRANDEAEIRSPHRGDAST